MGYVALKIITLVKNGPCSGANVRSAEYGPQAIILSSRNIVHGVEEVPSPLKMLPVLSQMELSVVMLIFIMGRVQESNL